MSGYLLPTRALHRDFGEEVAEIDLRQDLQDQIWTALRHALWERSLLVFRSQPLSSADFERIGRHFGRRQSPVKRFEARGPSPDQLWHSVGAIDDTPAIATVLCAGSDSVTMELVSTRSALQALPKDEQEQLAALSASHTFRSNPGGVAHHPLVVAHPHIAHRSLFMGYHVRRIEGVPAADSDAIIAELMARATQRDAVYRHDCGPGDVLIWDNWSLMHRACALRAGECRIVEEISIHTA